MRTLVFLSVMALSLAVEWLAVFKTGLIDRILDVPIHLMADSMKSLISSGSSWDFAICLGAVLAACATVSVLFYALVYTAYRVAIISSTPFAKD